MQGWDELPAVIVNFTDVASTGAKASSFMVALTGGRSAFAPSAAVTPAADQKPEGQLPTLEFERMDHDFGVVTEGQKVTYTYKFKNTGQAPLIVQNAAPSCGCTVPDWTREPIPVGGTGFVKAEFDTKGKVGPNTKTITVTANTWPKQTTLKFKASVTAAANATGPVQ